jgi:hypothetical protein
MFVMGRHYHPYLYVSTHALNSRGGSHPVGNRVRVYLYFGLFAAFGSLYSWCMDALRISPLYTSLDWNRLDFSNPKDWPKAAEIVRDRLDGRFLCFASACLKQRDSGFVVLAIDCLLAETIQQFRDGVTDGRNRSTEMITRFLEGKCFQPDFTPEARKAFYLDIRCGLLHQAEAKKMWLIRRKQPSLLQETVGGESYIIDVERFHTALQTSFDDYLKAIIESGNAPLQSNLWKKMNHICNVRAARGALYEAEDDHDEEEAHALSSENR